MSIGELKELQAKIIKKEKKCNLIISIFVSIMLLIMLILFFLDIDFMVITDLAVIVIISLFIFVIVKAFLHGDDIQIFERLREVNTLVNLQPQRRKKPLRFFYMLRDDIFESKDCKFTESW